MMISITVPETVIRAAHHRNLSIEAFVDSLIDKGMETAAGTSSAVSPDSRPTVSSAIERIRALHIDAIVPGH